MRKSMRTVVATVAMAMAAAGLATAMPSTAATPKPTYQPPPMSQTVSRTYVLPTNGSTIDTPTPVEIGGTYFPLPTWARYMSIVITDESGLPTYALINEESRSTWYYETTGDLCGRTTSSIPVDPSKYASVRVDLEQGMCPGAILAAGTEGTVTITFTN